MLEITNNPEHRKVYVEDVSETIDKQLEKLTEGKTNLHAMLQLAYLIQSTLSKAGYFLTQHSARQTHDNLENSVEKHSDKFKTTYGRNTSVITSAVQIFGALAGNPAVGTALAQGGNAQKEHWDQLANGDRNVSQYAIEKWKGIVDTLKNMSYTEKQQFEEQMRKINGLDEKITQAISSILR